MENARKRRIPVLLFAVVLALSITVGPAAAQPYAPPPTVDVGTINPGPGSKLPVTGKHWCPGSTVAIYLDGEFVTTVTVKPDGTFSTTIQVPGNSQAGDHVVEAVGMDETCSNVRSARANIVVGGAGGAAGGPGATLAFTGANLWVPILLLITLIVIGTTTLFAGRRRNVAEADRHL